MSAAPRFEALLYDVEDGVATITLNRPEAANALSPTMARELMEVAIEIDHDPEVRAVIWRAAGDRFFCAGGDLKAFASAGDRSPHLVKTMTTQLHAAISRLARGAAPVIGEVQGTAAGGGFSMVLGCDLVVASEKAKFTLAYTKASLSPDGSSTFFLTRAVGLRRAMDLALTNRVLGAAEAEGWGIVNRVVPAEELTSTVRRMAEGFARGPTDAYGRTKRLLLESTYTSFETQMELESRGIAESLGSRNGREGLAAFLEKREPEFEAF
jgi:2-(1,2-epoxy-1,2-dihydrophenyl)acetyl-CoA isomerase